MSESDQESVDGSRRRSQRLQNRQSPVPQRIPPTRRNSGGQTPVKTPKTRRLSLDEAGSESKRLTRSQVSKRGLKEELEPVNEIEEILSSSSSNDGDVVVVNDKVTNLKLARLPGQKRSTIDTPSKSVKKGNTKQTKAKNDEKTVEESHASHNTSDSSESNQKENENPQEISSKAIEKLATSSNKSSQKSNTSQVSEIGVVSKQDVPDVDLEVCIITDNQIHEQSPEKSSRTQSTLADIKKTLFTNDSATTDKDEEQPQKTGKSTDTSGDTPEQVPDEITTKGSPMKGERKKFLSPGTTPSQDSNSQLDPSKILRTTRSSSRLQKLSESSDTSNESKQNKDSDKSPSRNTSPMVSRTLKSTRGTSESSDLDKSEQSKNSTPQTSNQRSERSSSRLRLSSESHAEKREQEANQSEKETSVEMMDVDVDMDQSVTPKATKKAEDRESSVEKRMTRSGSKLPSTKTDSSDLDADAMTISQIMDYFNTDDNDKDKSLRRSPRLNKACPKVCVCIACADPKFSASTCVKIQRMETDSSLGSEVTEENPAKKTDESTPEIDSEKEKSTSDAERKGARKTVELSATKSPRKSTVAQEIQNTEEIIPDEVALHEKDQENNDNFELNLHLDGTLDKSQDTLEGDLKDKPSISSPKNQPNKQQLDSDEESNKKVSKSDSEENEDIDAKTTKVSPEKGANDTGDESTEETSAKKHNKNKQESPDEEEETDKEQESASDVVDEENKDSEDQEESLEEQSESEEDAKVAEVDGSDEKEEEKSESDESFNEVMTKIADCVKRSAEGEHVDSDYEENLRGKADSIVDKIVEKAKSAVPAFPDDSSDEEEESDDEDVNLDISNAFPNDVESKIDALIKSYRDSLETNDDVEDEDENEEDDLFHSMAEEGEEDTPSDDSNDIIDVGEEINTTDTEKSSEESEESDDNSFIDDEEKGELLSGEGDDLSFEDKRKSRIKTFDSDGDSDTIVPVKISEVKPVIRTPSKTRIIKRPTEESEDEEIHTIVSSSSSEKEHKSPVRKHSDKIVILEDIKLKQANQPQPTQDTSSSSEESYYEDYKKQINKEIVIQENLSLDDIRSKRLSNEIQKVVNVFCEEIKKEGAVSVKVALDYVAEPSDSKKKSNSQRRRARKRQLQIPPSQANVVPETNNKKKKLENINIEKKESIPQPRQESTSRNEPKKKKQIKTHNTNESTDKNIGKKDATEAGLESQKDRIPKKKKKQNRRTEPENSLGVLASALASDNFKTATNIPIQSDWEVTDNHFKIKPSVDTKSRESSIQSPSKKGHTDEFHIKDFKNRMLYNSNRIKREDTKTQLNKRRF